MADETDHARMAFALASGYEGRTIGPAPLPIEGALGGVTERNVFATLLREGCIGETIAAIAATDELERTEDPAVRGVLERIAADETRHAALAWRVARWLLGRGDRSFRDWARVEMARAFEDRMNANADGRSDLVRSALQAVIEPIAAALLEEVSAEVFTETGCRAA
jgi:hypothetical protein